MNALDRLTPRDAAAEMVAAGAVFSMRPSSNGLGATITYRVAAGGDAHRCSEVIAAAKSRPPAFFLAFRVAAQDLVAKADRGAA